MGTWRLISYLTWRCVNYHCLFMEIYVDIKQTGKSLRSSVEGDTIPSNVSCTFHPNTCCDPDTEL
jgi:hypothetical protein